MTNAPIASNADEAALTAAFLGAPNEELFADLFTILTPQLVAFFRARGVAGAAEDLAQEVMLTVYRKAEQVRDRASFRPWLFKIARHAMYRHFSKQAREVDTVDLSDVPEHRIATITKSEGTQAFEFNQWMAFLESREREALKLRFIEEWEYHEIASAQSIPIGTVQWRVFSAKKKLAPFLKTAETCLLRKAA